MSDFDDIEELFAEANQRLAEGVREISEAANLIAATDAKLRDLRDAVLPEDEVKSEVQSIAEVLKELTDRMSILESRFLEDAGANA